MKNFYNLKNAVSVNVKRVNDLVDPVQFAREIQVKELKPTGFGASRSNCLRDALLSVISGRRSKQEGEEYLMERLSKFKPDFKNGVLVKQYNLVLQYLDTKELLGQDITVKTRFNFKFIVKIRLNIHGQIPAIFYTGNKAYILKLSGDKSASETKSNSVIQKFVADYFDIAWNDVEFIESCFIENRVESYSNSQSEILVIFDLLMSVDNELNK